MKRTAFKRQFVIPGVVFFLLVSLVGVVFAAPPVINDQTFSVLENSATGTFVGDVGPDTYTYSITAGNGSGAFAINPSTGDITVADGSQIDYETTTQFILTVQADNVDGSDTATITIDVINVNDAPEITPNQTFSVAENSPSGASVGTVQATDPDGNPLTYSIIAGNTGNAFMINASTGEIQVQTSSVLNFEVGPTTYELIISVTDGGLSDTDVVTINVTDVNDPPVAVDDDNGYTVLEGMSLNGATPSVLANDTDEDGDALTAVLAAQPANGSVTLDSSGVFTYTPNTNFNGVDTFTYYANDGTVNSPNTATVTITVTGYNDPPIAYDDTFGPTDEDTILNEPAPGVLGNDTDPENDSLTVSSADSVSAQGAAVNVNTDGSFSYDPTGAAALQALPQGDVITDTFTYVITDGAALSAPAVVSVTVTGVNDAPTDISLSSASVAENSAAGTPIGSFSTTDLDSGDTFTYTLVTGNGSAGNASFQIVGNQLQTNAVFDFETQSSYTIRVRSTDAGGLWFEKIFTINVTNVNDAPTDISLSNASVPENSAMGTLVGSFSTTDQDAGDTFVYELVSGAGSTGNASFQIVGNQLQTSAALDFETQSSYSIRVRSTDAGGLSYEKIFTISVTDVNEAPTGISLDNNSVLEEQPAGTAVGNFSTTDPDSGDTFTYVLTDTTTYPDNAAFQIVGNQLQTAAVLDFETQSSYTIQVRSTDSGGLWVEQTFTITVIDGNDPPTDIALSNANVDENQPSGTVVGVLSGTDPNAGDTLTFSLVPNVVDNSSFAVNGTNLETAVSFDFETRNSYTVRVRVTDQGGLYFDKDFTITINDVNDAPTDITLSPSSMAENNNTGDLVGNFSTTDQDDTTFTYILTDTTNFPDNNSFTITGAELRANAVFDYETKNSYTIRVYSRDAGGLWVEKTLTVLITDVNEPPTDVTLDNNTVAENQPMGTYIGQFGVIDPDSSSFTYVLPSGVLDNDSFTVLVNDGRLYTNAVFDYEVQNSYTISVTVNDGLNNFQKAFTILITNANDAPTAVDDTGQTTDEDTSLNVTAPGVLGNDTDPENDALSVSGADSASAQGAAVTVNADGSFSYDPTGAAALQALGAGESLNDTFNYTVSDGNGGADVGLVTVQVTGVNDAPTAQDDTANTPPNTAVTINVLNNDSDVDASDTLNVTAVTQGALGTAAINGNNILYTPNAGVEGDDSFTYTISDGVLTATARVTVTIGLRYIYLPLIVNPGPAVNAPDLVVTNIAASSSEVQVTIRNQGNVSTTTGFWVDFYVDPNPVPTHANQLWDDLGSEGIAWGVTIPINPGETLTLTYSTAPGAPNTFVSAVDTNFTGALAPGTPVYAQVDSAHAGRANGAIDETHEILGEPYNNVSSMFTSTAVSAAANVTAAGQTAAVEANFILPVR